MLKGTGAETGGERARECAASRRTDAEWLGSAAGVASACDGPRVQTRERPCELRNNLALAPSGWKSTTESGASARRDGTLASSASVERQRDERVGFSPFPGECVHVRGRKGARLRVKARACARRGHGHGDGRDHGGDMMTRRTRGRTRKEGQQAGCACGEDGCGTCTKR
jgi:hypothetical protein